MAQLGIGKVEAKAVVKVQSGIRWDIEVNLGKSVRIGPLIANSWTRVRMHI
jgi:hypothetical protein